MNRLLASNSIRNSDFTHAPNVSCYTPESLVDDIRDICDRYVYEFEKFEGSNICTEYLAVLLKTPVTKPKPTYQNTVRRLHHLRRELRRANSFLWMLIYTGEQRFSHVLSECHTLIWYADKVGLQSSTTFTMLDEIDTSLLSNAQKRVLRRRKQRGAKAGERLNKSTTQSFEETQRSIFSVSERIHAHYKRARLEQIKVDSLEEVEGLPHHILEEAAKRARQNGHLEATAFSGPWHLVTDDTTEYMVARHAVSRDLRKRFYDSGSLSEKNDLRLRNLYQDFLTLCRKNAKRLGFESPAKMQNEEMTAKSVAEVMSLLQRLHSEVHKGKERTHKLHRQIKFIGTPASHVSQEFSLGTNAIYKNGSSNGVLAFRRKSFRNISVAKETTFEPIAYVSCSQAQPSREDQHAPMHLADVTSLFHEFGHALQHVMAKSPTSEASGVGAIEEDVIEVASQFMEAWCFDTHTIKEFAKHRETGAPLDDEFIGRLASEYAAYLNQNLSSMVASSWADLHFHGEGYRTFVDSWHSAYSLVLDLGGVQSRANPQALLRPGQAYRYLWSQMFVEDALALFKGTQGDDDAERALGRKFAQTVMMEGGSDDPLDIFRAFRGRKVSRIPLIARVAESQKPPSLNLWKDLKNKIARVVSP